MRAAATKAQTALGPTRRLSVVCGVIAVLTLGLVSDGNAAARVALLALAAHGFATSLGWLQLVLARRLDRPIVTAAASRSYRQWVYVAIVVTLGASAAVQTWFQAGTTIAGGDSGPPDGIAWVGRLFEPWTWGGSSLGESSQLPLQLPWAAIVAILNQLGGDAALAQRIWYTVLLAAAGLGAVLLIASLRMGPIAALVGAAIYVLNPFVISVVHTNPVYLAALCPLATVPAAVVAAGTGRLSVRWSAVLIALQAPIVGYVFINPPLVAMILGVAIALPVLVAWLDGRDAGLRSARALLLGI